jgi:hypothetical protein
MLGQQLPNETLRQQLLEMPLAMIVEAESVDISITTELDRTGKSPWKVFEKLKRATLMCFRSFVSSKNNRALI